MPHTEEHSVSHSGEPHADRRNEIMKVTARCLQDVGYDRTTIRKIASDLDCAIGSIYRYFKDKRELLYAVTQQVLEPVADVAETGRSFAVSARMYQERALGSPQAYRLMFWLASLEPPRDASTPTTPLPNVIRRIVAGWARTLGDPALAGECWSLLHGSIMLGQSHTAVIDRLLDLSSAVPHARDVPAPGEALAPSPNGLEDSDRGLEPATVGAPHRVDPQHESPPGPAEATKDSEDVWML